jgi:indolepyruvate ferredoxin oxidoreductase
VAENAYRLMAYKDEYEVARLYGSAEFKASLAAQFSDTRRISLWLAPPLLSRIDPATGRPKKRKFGPWILPAFTLLARLKFLRGSRFDPFGQTQERRAERHLAEDYLAVIADTCATLERDGLAQALLLAQLPQEIRGFGPVKEEAMQAYWKKRAELLAAPQASLRTGT